MQDQIFRTTQKELKTRHHGFRNPYCQGPSESASEKVHFATTVRRINGDALASSLSRQKCTNIRIKTKSESAAREQASGASSRADEGPHAPGSGSPHPAAGLERPLDVNGPSAVSLRNVATGRGARGIRSQYHQTLDSSALTCIRSDLHGEDAKLPAKFSGSVKLESSVLV